MTKKRFLLGMLTMALIFGIVLAACSDDSNSGSNPSFPKGKPSQQKDDWSSKEYPQSLTIKSDGNGAVETLITSSDPSYESVPLKILQVIPDFTDASSELSESVLIAKSISRAVNKSGSSFRAAGVSKKWPANSPIIVFFDDKIYLEAIESNFEILVGAGVLKEQVYGTIAISSSPDISGNLRAILTFTPYKPFDVNKGVTINIRKGLKDKCGNGMNEDTVISFIAEEPKGEGSFTADNWGFEAGMSGIEITGDGIIFEGNGTLVPHSGEKLAAISSGDSYYAGGGTTSILSDTPSIEEKSSFLKLGPINTKFTKLSLWYDFISAEFDEFAPSLFDDQAVITIYGPNGTVSETLTSVNTIGKLGPGKQYIGTLNMPDRGDDFAGQTGWTQFVLDDIDVGTPAYIIFTVSDITDTIYSSILAVDDLILSED